MRTHFAPRAITSAALVAAAMMLGPAAAAFASTVTESPAPGQTATETTDVGHGAYRPCLHGGPGCPKPLKGKEPAMKPEEKGPTG